VGSERSGCGLGSVSLRALGVRCSLGLDVGGRRALGICAIPLRALGSGIRRTLGLGAWTCSSCRRGLCATGVCACAGGVRWRRGCSSSNRTGRPRRSWSGVVSFGPAGRLGAFVPRERSLRVKSQRDEFASDQPDGNRECLQHHSGESDDCGEPHLHVREFAPRGYRCFEKCISEWRSCRQGPRSSESAADSTRAGGGDRRSSAHSSGCRRTECSCEAVGASSGKACEQAGRNEDGAFGSSNSRRADKTHTERVSHCDECEACSRAAGKQSRSAASQSAAATLSRKATYNAAE
jgi:hypothetical protein